MSLIIRQGMTGMEAAPVRRRHRDISWLFDQEASARKRAYELTDSFVQQPYAADHGHLRARVRGRADDVLSYQGVDIHPRVVRSVLVRSPEILGYQVR